MQEDDRRHPPGAPLRIQRGRIRVGDAWIAYERSGVGEPVVLVPPIMGDRRMWDNQVQSFARHHAVIRFDLRGYGCSSAGARTERPAEDLLGLLDALGLERVALLGFENGAEIALELATDHPERLCAVVLTNPIVRFVLSRVLQGESRVEDGGPPINLSPSERRMGRAVNLRLLEIRVENLIRQSARMWPRSRRVRYPLARWAATPVLDRLAQVTAPALIVRGEWSHPLQREGDALLQAAMTNCTIARLPRASFAVQLEAPEAFNRIVLDFLARHSQTNVPDAETQT